MSNYAEANKLLKPSVDLVAAKRLAGSDFYLIHVHADLLAQMGDWSEPLQVKVEQEGLDIRLVFRRPSPDNK